jgi:apolipoprotein D and lipocalin family protein
MVQFFWPFKGDYWLLALDDDYQYAMVGHPSKKYLWILSRTPEMRHSVYQSLVEKAAQEGYDVSRIKKTICNDAS